MKSLKPECHELVEHILRMPAKTARMRWLVHEMVDMLKDRGNVDELTADYCATLEIQNPYLAELTKTYEENL